MGDCRLRIQISKRLLLLKDDGRSDSPLCTTSKVWSADTTLHDVLEQTGASTTTPSATTTLQSLVRDYGATVWDCTIFPATNITSDCRTAEAQTKTLFAAGWFPSGCLQFLPADAVTSVVAGAADIYDDYQYSKCTAIREVGSSAKVQYMGVKSSVVAMLPSQVLHSVTQRFDDDHDETAATDASRVRQQNKLLRQQVDEARARKLEERIRKLSEAEKKPVSDQVRRMLIKSGATGRAGLKVEDRVYLRCVLWDDDNKDDLSNKEIYRYFSIQDTVGRALSTFAPPTQHRQNEVEMLVAVGSGGEVNYRRLPVPMRFYEALAHSFLLGAVDTVVIRWYSPEQGSTAMITDSVDDSQPDVCDVDATMMNAATTVYVGKSFPIDCTDAKTQVITRDVTAVVTQSAAYTHLAETLRTLEKDRRKGKKASSAAAKVREMQIKSKAVGDAKRVKMPDRFFLELVTVADEPCSNLYVVPVFLAKSDPLDRLMRDCASAKPPAFSNWSWELLVASTSADDAVAFRQIAASDDSHIETWQDAEHNGLVKCFDQVILRYFLAK